MNRYIIAMKLALPALLQHQTTQLALLLALVGGFAIVQYRATHPASVIMHIDGQEVESKVLGYAPACAAKAPFTPIPVQSESPIRN